MGINKDDVNPAEHALLYFGQGLPKYSGFTGFCEEFDFHVSASMLRTDKIVH